MSGTVGSKTAVDSGLRKVIDGLRPGLDLSMDGAAVIDGNCRVVYFNKVLRILLGMKHRQLSAFPVFYDLIEVKGCSGGAAFRSLVKRGKPIELFETPAERGRTKFRLSVKGSAVYAAGEGDRPAGGLILMRDSTAEFVLQAKYHRMQLMLEEAETALMGREEELRKLRRTLRNAAGRRW